MPTKFTINSILFIALTLTAASTANADINTMGNICHPLNLPAADLNWSENGITNLAPRDQTVVCAVPRSPIAANTAASFIVEGSNRTGTISHCSLVVANGAGSKSFESFDMAGATSRNLITFSPARIANSDYVELTCTLVAANNGPGGIIRGIIAVGP